MGEIVILEKNTADYLKTMGFNYTETSIGDTIVFKFINTPQLKKALSEKFTSLNYVVSDTINF